MDTVLRLAGAERKESGRLIEIRRDEPPAGLPAAFAQREAFGFYLCINSGSHIRRFEDVVASLAERFGDVRVESLDD